MVKLEIDLLLDKQRVALFWTEGDRRQGIHVIRARGEAQKGEVCPADASPPSSYALGTLLVPDLI